MKAHRFREAPLGFRGGWYVCVDCGVGSMPWSTWHRWTSDGGATWHDYSEAAPLPGCSANDNREVLS
jgi:hypothetical protein